MFRELLVERLKGLCQLTPEELDQLENHYQLLLRWNQTLNLTRIEGAEEIVEHHYAESLFLGIHLPTGRLSIADVGSGAGFPGIPVAILRRDCTVTLIESHKRKAVFLKEATRNMAHVRVIADRAEARTEQFDWVLSRAVRWADLEKIAEKIGLNVALLTGAQPIRSATFEFAAPFRLPWGKARLLWLGRRST